jgi:hypothetical protein
MKAGFTKENSKGDAKVSQPSSESESLLSMGSAKVSEKGSDGLDANQIVFYPIVLVGRVKCVRIQTKAEEDRVRTQFLLE